MNKLKVLIWDLETAGVNGLRSDLGWIICVGYKWLGEKKTHIIKLSDYPDFMRNPTDDRKLLKDFYEIFKQADFTVAHFGSVFDRRFLEGRLAIAGLDPLPETKLVDTCMVARSKFNFSSNRLKHLAKILGCKNQKADNDWPDAWIDTIRGGEVGKKALNGIAEYCKQDVRTLEEVYMKIRTRITQHPHVGVIEGGDKQLTCRICGSDKIKRNGVRITASGMLRQECQCQKCGSYSRHPMPKKD